MGWFEFAVIVTVVFAAGWLWRYRRISGDQGDG